MFTVFDMISHNIPPTVKKWLASQSWINDYKKNTMD